MHIHCPTVQHFRKAGIIFSTNKVNLYVVHQIFHDAGDCDWDVISDTRWVIYTFIAKKSRGGKWQEFVIITASQQKKDWSLLTLSARTVKNLWQNNQHYWCMLQQELGLRCGHKYKNTDRWFRYQSSGFYLITPGDCKA